MILRRQERALASSADSLLAHKDPVHRAKPRAPPELLLSVMLSPWMQVQLLSALRLRQVLVKLAGSQFQQLLCLSVSSCDNTQLLAFSGIRFM